MITAIVLTIGPMELSEKTEKQIDMVAIDNNDKYAKQNAKPYLHMISDSGIMTSPSLFNTIKSPVPNIICPTIRDKKASHKVRKKVYIAPAKNFDNKKLLLLIGLVPIILRVPMAASPETKSPVTSATNKGTWTISICRIINAIKFPLRISPLKLKVCSKEEVTKDIKFSPSAFIANKITAIRTVSAKKPM